MLVQFEQNCMVQTTPEILSFLTKKQVFINIFWQRVDAILEDILWRKLLFNAKLLI